LAFLRAAELSAGSFRADAFSAPRFRARALRAALSTMMAIAVAALLGVSAAQAVEAVNVHTDAGAIDLTGAVQIEHTDGDRIQVSTAPGDDSRASSTSRRHRAIRRNGRTVPTPTFTASHSTPAP
jgi:hypothetical protein